MLVERLLSETGLKRQRLETYASSASKRYYIFRIPKRSGGTREIAHPAKPMKALQRWLNLRLFRAFKIHDSAMAYRSGRGIKSNAARHLGTSYTTRIDFENFFPSFSRNGIEKFLIQRLDTYSHYDKNDIPIILDIVTRNGSLTIGAPSSPIITNAMMYEFDHAMDEWCKTNELIYTRYADDIFISSRKRNMLFEAIGAVEKHVKDFSYVDLEINHKKTTHCGKKRARRITGLIITSENKISIGRSRKRMIKSLVNDYKNGKVDAEHCAILKGLLAFSYDVEPIFIQSLISKYGKDIIAEICKVD